MTQVKYFMAVDLGATSGRTILGSLQNGKLEQEELTRFANPIIQLGRHFYWDIYALYNEIVRGLKTAAVWSSPAWASTRGGWTSCA